MTLSNRFTSCSLLLALTLGACASEEEDAASVTTLALQAKSEADLLDAVLDLEGVASPDPSEAARLVAERPAGRLQPQGCMQKSQQGDTVTFELEGCTGALGMVELHGTLVATFSKTAENLLHVVLVSQPGTRANDRELTYSAESDVRYETPNTRRYAYRGSTKGVTARGRAYARDTELTVSVDTQTECVSIDGASRGSVGPYTLDVSLEGMRGCRASCPSAGRVTATVEGPRAQSASITVQFDGSEQAHVERGGRRTRERSVRLDCAAGEAG